MTTTRRPPLPEVTAEADSADHDPIGGGPPPDPAPPGRRRWPRWIAVAIGALAFGFLSGFALRDAGVQLSTTAPADGAHLSAAETDELVFRIASDLPTLMRSARLEYDDTDVRAQAFVADGELTYRPRDLSEGTHTLSFAMDQPFAPWPVRRSWTFTIDTTRPAIAITGPARPAVRGAPVTLSGRVDEPADVTIDGRPVAVAEDGSFSLDLPAPPPAPLTIRATDRAGNARGISAAVPVMARIPAAPTRAVHMTAISWKTDVLREPVLAMLRSGQINAIQLDLKDESGVVGYNSRVPMARAIGAVQQSYVLEDAVRQIHNLGGRVVGRVVAFRDPIHARYAWDNGLREQVIQTPSGQPYAQYGGFTNFSDPVVRQYNIDIAREAAEAGVDDILYDYIRRPDGPIETMVFPNLSGGARNSIVSFLAEARAALEPSGAFLGASLFGIAAFDADLVAQDVPRIARNVDYVAPLIYPSHWGAGIYGIADPEAQPRAVIRQSVARFNDLARGSGARVVPWLQDFSLRVPYGPKEICAQLEGARDEGVSEWIMWDPHVTYTRAGCLKG